MADDESPLKLFFNTCLTFCICFYIIFALLYSCIQTSANYLLAVAFRMNSFSWKQIETLHVSSKRAVSGAYQKFYRTKEYEQKEMNRREKDDKSKYATVSRKIQYHGLFEEILGQTFS